MTFVERVLELIEENGISKNKLLTDLKLSKNSFVNWIDRGTTPNGDTIAKIANYFGVSVDELLGVEKSLSEELALTDKQKKVLDLAQDLSDEDMKKLIDYANLLKKAKNQ